MVEPVAQTELALPFAGQALDTLLWGLGFRV